MKLLLILKNSKNYHKITFIFITILISTGLLTIYFYDPSVSNVYPHCPFHYLTGYNCPGCGSMRGLHSLLKGDLLLAMDFNILMVITVPYFIYNYISYFIFAFWKKRLPVLFKTRWSVLVIFFLIVIYWIVRNLPFYPFSWLGA